MRVSLSGNFIIRVWVTGQTSWETKTHTDKSTPTQDFTKGGEVKEKNPTYLLFFFQCEVLYTVTCRSVQILPKDKPHKMGEDCSWYGRKMCACYERGFKVYQIQTEWLNRISISLNPFCHVLKYLYSSSSSFIYSFIMTSDQIYLNFACRKSWVLHLLPLKAWTTVSWELCIVSAVITP